MGEEMTSRQRLLTVLQHKLPDRIPVSTYDMTGWHLEPRDTRPGADPLQEYCRKHIFGAYMSGWWNEAPSYGPLMEHIRENADCLYMTDVETVNRYTAEHTHIEQRTEGDSIYTYITTVTPKGDLTQTFREDRGIHTAWQLEHKIKDEKDIEKFMSIPFDPLPVNTEHLKAQDKYIGDKGILLIDVMDPIYEVFDLFDFGEFTIFAMMEEKTITRMLDKVFEQQYYFLEEMLKKGVGPLFRFSGAEACTPPYLPNRLFDQYVTRYDKELIRLIHDHGQFARVHSHGKVRTVLPNLLEMEADALDPLEAPPSGDVELWEAKEICKDRICLFGNIQLKDLEFLPPERMREMMRKCIEEGKPGGNFVALPTATPLNEPLSARTEENFRIFVDMVLEYGRYS